MARIVRRTKSGKGAMVILTETDAERAERRRRRIAHAQDQAKEAVFTTGQMKALNDASRSSRRG